MAMTTYEPVFRSGARVVLEPLPLPLDESGDSQAAGRTSARRRTVPRPAPRPEPLACRGSVAPSVHGGTLTRRGRVVVTLVWLLLAGAAVLAFVRPWDGGAAAGAGVTSTVRVEAGDTLWELAGHVAPSADRREIVAAIVELNGLSSAADIHPGDALRVPAGR